MGDDDNQQQGPGSQSQEGGPGSGPSGGSGDSGSGSSALDRPNDIVTDLREGDQQGRERR